MQILRVNVANEIATYLSRGGTIICGNTKYKIAFSFDASWDKHPEKIARFIWNGAYKDVPFTGTECAVPKITGADQVQIGVYAGDLKTTTAAIIPARRSILCGSNKAHPDQAKEYRDEAAQYAEQAAQYAEQAKAVVEEAGDIDAALDAILAIQAELLGGVLEYELGTSYNGDPYYIVKGIGTYKSAELIIPDTYKGIVVSEIAEDAFRGNTKLTSAVIGKNVLTIGKCAFEGCSNLTSIQLTKERTIDKTNPDWWMEECYGQTDTAIYSRLASDSDPAKVASLWTTTQNEGAAWGADDHLSTDAWYWTALPN